MNEEDSRKYKEYLIEKIVSLDKYNDYMIEHTNSLKLFLDIVEFKEGSEFNRITNIVEQLSKLIEDKSKIIDTFISYFNDVSQTIQFKDVHDRTIFYERILKIKNIENDGSTEA